MSSWQRFIYGSDSHGDKADKNACEIFFQFVEQWKPQIRIHGGDNWDFRPLRTKASDEEKRESMQADFDAGKDFLLRYRPTHFLRGNHDERLWDLARDHRGPLTDLANRGTQEIEQLLAEMNCRMLPYHKRNGVLQLGHLKAIHGFAHGVNAARRSAQAYGSVLMGHGHGIQHVSIEGIENRVGRMCGCLCQLDHDYNRAQLASLAHRHGFAYGAIHAITGNYHVWQAEDINGSWLLPSDVVEL